MKTKITIFFAIFLTIAFSSAFASESTTFRGESYTLGKDETISGDLYVEAWEVAIDGKVDGNIYIHGGEIEFNGDVTGSALIRGFEVDVGGVIEGNAFIYGFEVDIPGTVNGNLHAAALELDLSGVYLSKTNAEAFKIDASGEFVGESNIKSGEFTIKDDALFSGDLNYSADTFKLSPGATTSGAVNKIVSEDEEKCTPFECGRGKGIFAAIWVVFLIGFIIVGLVLNKLFPDFVSGITERVFPQMLNNLGWGVLVLLLAPIAVIILVFTLVGIPLAVLITLSCLIGLYIGEILVAVATGGLIFSLFKKEGISYWIKLLVGALVVFILSTIPILGFFVGIIIYILGIGAIKGYLVSLRKGDV